MCVCFCATNSLQEYLFHLEIRYTARHIHTYTRVYERKSILNNTFERWKDSAGSRRKPHCPRNGRSLTSPPSTDGRALYSWMCAKLKLKLIFHSCWSGGVQRNSWWFLYAAFAVIPLRKGWRRSRNMQTHWLCKCCRCQWYIAGHLVQCINIANVALPLVGRCCCFIFPLLRFHLDSLLEKWFVIYENDIALFKYCIVIFDPCLGANRYVHGLRLHWLEFRKLWDSFQF